MVGNGVCIMTTRTALLEFAQLLKGQQQKRSVRRLVCRILLAKGRNAPIHSGTQKEGACPYTVHGVALLVVEKCIVRSEQSPIVLQPLHSRVRVRMANSLNHGLQLRQT